MTAQGRARLSDRQDGPTAGLRPVGLGDAGALFDWVTDPEVRQVSLSDHAVTWPSHLRWLEQRLEDERSLVLMAEIDGTTVGYVRFQDKGQGPEAAIYVVPAARGRGLAARWLAEATALAARRWPGTPILARIRPANATSRRLFERCGYVLQGQRPDHLILHYTGRAGGPDR